MAENRQGHPVFLIIKKEKGIYNRFSFFRKVFSLFRFSLYHAIFLPAALHQNQFLPHPAFFIPYP